MPALFARTAGCDHRISADPDTEGDAATIGRILHATGVLTPVAALADVTGWDQRRLHAALDGLDTALHPAGLVLHRLGNRIGIRGRGDIDEDVVAAALKSHLNRDGLSLTEIRLLRRILDGDCPAQPTNAEQVALGVLANARLIEPLGVGRWQAHPDLVFSVAVNDS